MQRNSTRYSVASLTHPSSIYHHSTSSSETFLTGHNQDTVPSHCSSALGISLWTSVSGFCSTFLMKMIFAEYLVLSSLVLGVQLFLYQTQRIQFVQVSGTAKIHCFSTENLKRESSMFWYLRREGEKPTCIKRCLDDQNVSKFACKHKTYRSTLEIRNVQKTDSGIYYCAYKYSSYLIFGNGSTLIVGDSYTNSSWVMLLVPFPRGSQVTGTANLACVIHGVSSPVHVSWSVSGELQEQGLTRSLKARDGSLTLINHISVPMDTWTSGKNFTCEVKFNSSGNTVKKSTRYSVVPASDCSHYIVPLAAGTGLLLLVMSLSLVWTLCPSTLGFQPRVSAPPASEEHQGGILYAHLDFNSRNRNGHTIQRSARGKV
ncbi:immunoglobulin alpha-2 heavy chain-like isoform X2 [Dermochelys coriacea]|uniref:immunoglobulin alpha-2 heavy chain-like isoform X2 n=1 Tax=Dermochelys coriacea TaxID=27794 RepID=UPI001CA94EB7|nr:immunoglobulin alpha-2 heavy chain-like isoform X2 [Dermochelys coriacea]